MAFLSQTLATTILYLISSLTPVSAQSDNASGCSCYRTNGSSLGYFTSHRFLDYRNVSPAPLTIPSVISNPTSATNALASSDFFVGDAWTNFWTVQKFNNSDTRHSTDATALMVNSPSNVYIEKSQDSDPSYSTYLTLRTARLDDFQSAAEIDSIEKNFHFLSARFSARVVGSPGACAGMFTYLAGDTPQDVQEADIEILTEGPRNAVQYTNQPSVDTKGAVVPQATVNGTNPGGKDWTHWNVYRVDWMPGTTTWYVNGAKVANIDFQTPKDPAGLMVNMWSDGGSWTGNMSLHDQAYLQIQWIELAYNTSGPYTGSGARKRNEGYGSEGALVKRKGTPGCKAVCSVDEEINTTGTPALLWNNTSLAPLAWKGQGMGCLAWIPFLLVGAAVFGYF
ncbi:Concanavalin A-like lectin [Venustampulla echinocandica]|uniref:Concanavalin A-like lectin n=1 Tax=Venustampulla echinocandica TaxID=2656787 RepID=A0A370TT74_9HELO|nr:Concanavalin A-like lectin [Venustampulla echinocandica]RDL38713.1 Concanavalin A-like lectin [Venustampulla echinocandica]